MKKGLAIILILVSGFGLRAQETFVPQASIGIRQGVVFSRVRFDPVISQGLKFGYSGGLIFKHFSQKGLGIQLEVNYSQQGWTEKLDSPDSYSRQLNFISIPFMSHFEIGKGKTKFLLNIGPNLCYLISGKENIQLNDPTSARTYYGANTLKKTEFSICVGLGLVKTTPIGIFQIESRYNHSFSDIFTNTTALSILAGSLQNLELSISYMIDFNNIKKIF